MLYLLVSSFASLLFVTSAAVSYQYDALGRLEFVSYPNGEIIKYIYDANGNRTQVVVETGNPPDQPPGYESPVTGSKVVVLPFGGMLTIIPVEDAS